MTQQIIKIGATPNDGNGDPLRTAFGKINNNFSELFQTTLPAGPDGSVQYRAANDVTSVAWGNNLYVAIGRVNRVYTSLDGTNWVAQAGPGVTLTSILWDGGKWVAVGDGGTAWTSPDAVTWTARTTGITADLYSVALGAGGALCAVGGAGEIITSADGINWTGRSSGVATPLRGVTWSGALGAWVAVGDGGVITASANGGVTWVPVISGVLTALNAVTAAGNRVIAVGNGGVILNSPDILTWTIDTSGTVQNLRGIAAVTISTTTTAFACGDAGTILSTVGPNFNGWESTTYPSPTQSALLNATAGNSQVFMSGAGGVIVRFDLGELELDNIPGGLSGSSRFVFNPGANLLTVDAGIRPIASNTWSLGSTSNRWATLWADGNAGVVVGDVVFRAGGNTLTLHELGNVSNLSNLVVNSITISGNATYSNILVGNLTVTGNTALNTVSANTITANAANITNFSGADANFAGNIALAGNLQGNGGAQFAGNVVGNYIFGNGAFLTGIPSGNGGGAVGPFGAIQWSNGVGNNLSSPNLYWDNTTRTLYSENFNGNLTGNFTGNLQGNVAGNLQGNVTGNVIGDLTGNVTGNAVLYWANTQNLNAPNTANIGTLNVANSANVAGNLQVTGNITAAGFTVANLGIGNAHITGNLLVDGNVRLAGNSNIEYIESNLANIVELEVYHSNTLLANIDELTGNTANIIEIESDDITANKVAGNWGNFVNLNAQLATFTTANAQTFNGNSNANLVTAGNIQVYNNVIANNYTANGNFYGNFVGNLTSNTLTVNTIIANTGNIANVNANIIDANVVAANIFVGDLTGNVVGNITGATGVFTTSVTAPTVSATTFAGNLAGNVTGNVTGNIAGATGAFTGNVTVGGNLRVAGTTELIGPLTAGMSILGQTNVSTLYAGGNITTLGNVLAGNLVSANFLSGTLTSGPQPGVTSVGILDNLDVTGNITANGNIRGNNLTVLGNSSMGNAVITGNLTVSGNTTYIDVTTLNVEDPIIQQGGGPNGAPLTLNDGKDRGLLQFYYTTQPVTAFMGYKNNLGNFILASNVSVLNDVVTVNTLGNLEINNLVSNTVFSNAANIANVTAANVVANKVTANYLQGDGSNLSGLPVQNLTAGGNITLINNSGNWTISASGGGGAAGGNAGEIQFSDGNGQFAASPNLIYNTLSGNLTLSGNMTATRFWGNLTGNVTGNVVGNLAGNVVGNFSGNATGNFNGNMTGGNITATNANITTVTANSLTANTANITTITGTLATPDQPNITSVGQLILLNVLSDIQAGNVWANAGTVGASLLTGSLTTAAQPNITSVGLLNSLSVFGNTTSGNINGGNLVRANFLQGTITANSNAQPNITSLGNLTGLTVTGAANLANATAGNLGVTANLTAANLSVTTGANIATLDVNGNTDLGNIRVEGSNITDRGTGNLHTFTITSVDAPITLRGPSSTIANSNAQPITIITGTAVGDARSGNLNLYTANGASANGGNINLYAGNAQLAGRLGGSVNIVAGYTWGDPNTITGSNVYIQSGNTLNEDGGAVVIQGGNASGPLVYGGNIYITPGQGDIANNANYSGYLYLANLRWPIADGGNYETIVTDGNGILSFANIGNIPGVDYGFRRITANGNLLLSNISPNLTIRASNVAMVTQPGGVQTVGLRGIPATSNAEQNTVELRVTPTGVYIDNPFSGNIDFSTSGNVLQNDFESLEGAEIGTNWTWDMSKNPLAGLQRFDLGLIP